jgi:hypothetical protein
MTQDDNIEKKPVTYPQEITTENKFNITGDYFKGNYLDNGGKVLFNWLYEFIDRNPDSVFATDIFRLDGFSNEQVQVVQKILHAAMHNISILAAEFVSGRYPYDDLVASQGIDK